jgi:predicted phosphate transport protein (TIGR00153 family)
MRLSIVPQQRRFYTLFAEQGRLVEETLAELGKSLLEGRSRHPRLRDLEHRCDDVTHEIYQLLNRSFVTPLEREDIFNLAASLDDIVDLAEEAADKMELYGVSTVPEHARAVGEVLASAGQEIARALADLEGFKDLETRRIEIHRLENVADQLNREALRVLFAGDLPAAELVKWKDIYDLLEATIDRCEQTANVLEAISIKNA